jgi:8-oxo-dGTP diphosphatase
MEPDKSAGVKWFTLGDLPGNVVPHERYILERLATGLPPMVIFGFSEPKMRAATG